MPFFRFTCTGLLIAAGFALTSCSGPNNLLNQFQNSFGSSVVTSSADRTPPLVSLVIPDLGSGKITLTSGGTNRTIPITPQLDPFFIVGVVDDPEGVKDIRFSGGATTVCKEGDLGANTSQDLAGPASTNKAVAGGTATTRLWLPNYIDLGNYGCPQGFKIISVSISVAVLGTNYGGQQVSSPYATFTYNP